MDQGPIHNEMDILIIMMMMMGSYNARHIYPTGYTQGAAVGATVALIRQPQPHPSSDL